MDKDQAAPEAEAPADPPENPYDDPANPGVSIITEDSQVEFDRLAIYRMIDSKRTELANAKAAYYLSRANVPGLEHPNKILGGIGQIRLALDVLIAMADDTEKSGAAVPEPGPLTAVQGGQMPRRG